MTSSQHLSTLILLNKLPQKEKATLLGQCQGDFIHFLSDCVVNTLRGTIRGISRETLEPFNTQIQSIIKRKTSIGERRAIFRSEKGLKLLTIIGPRVENYLKQ